MGHIGHLIQGRAAAAWALIALTLAMKLLVPVGFMPQVAGGGVQFIVCDGMDHTAVHAMPGIAHRHHDKSPSKPDAPCPFAGLTAPTLGGADPVQLATLIVAIMAAGLLLVTALPRRTTAHLRPPLRGPPLHA